MKRIFKPALLFVTAAVVFLTLSPASSAGLSPEGLGAARRLSPSAAAAAAPAAKRAEARPLAAQAPADAAVSDYRAFLAAVAGLYVARDTDFSVRYDNIGFDEANRILSGNQIWDGIFSCDLPDTTSDLDYLRFNMRGTMQVTGWSYGTYAVFRFSQTFWTTAEQEAYVDDALGRILGGLDIAGLSPDARVRAIHDYITDNVEYDETLTKYSAYDALYSGEAVCNGYALLLYKMLEEAGVPARAVSGAGIDGGGGEDHLWNIVRLGAYWYNIDATWDDTARTADYYLKSNAGFSDHIRDEEYDTETFNAAHPMSPVDFDAPPAAGNASASAPPEPAAAPEGAPGDWAKDAVAALTARGFVPKALTAGFQEPVTRGEFTALMAGVYEYARGDYTPVNEPPFTDIAGSPYEAEIAKGYELGLISGMSDTEFMPGGTLTREQCAKLISITAALAFDADVISSATIKASVLPYGDSASVQSWAAPYVLYAYENGLMNGTGVNFEPGSSLTREQALVIAERMLEKYGW